MRPVYGKESSSLPPLRARAIAAFRERGVAGMAGGALREARERLRRASESGTVAQRRTFGPRTFVLDGTAYRYFYHRYNTTWRNERIVEIPVAQRAVEAAKGRRILEVGNVLAHYYRGTHDILDKYERAPGVVNADVVDFRPGKEYDLIVSVSTIEHVGFDEEPRDSTKTLRAVEHLKTLLAPGGTMLVTVPLGYNPDLDALLREGRFPFTKIRTLKRVSADNRWQEVAWDEVKDARYGAPFPAANAVLIGMLEKERSS